MPTPEEDPELIAHAAEIHRRAERKTSWPDPDLRHCQQDWNDLDADDHDDPQQLLR
jgi:hypothetical protein